MERARLFCGGVVCIRAQGKLLHVVQICQKSRRRSCVLCYIVGSRNLSFNFCDISLQEWTTDLRWEPNRNSIVEGQTIGQARGSAWLLSKGLLILIIGSPKRATRENQILMSKWGIMSSVLPQNLFQGFLLLQFVNTIVAWISHSR